MTNVKDWSGKQVLLIDSLEDDAKQTLTTLEELGFRCLYATEGVKGIEAAQKHKPDIILMDWSIPDIDGQAVLDTLKTNKDTRTIPIIVITGSSLSNATMCMALCENADDYIRKPLERNELIARIAANLRLYRIIGLIQQRSERLARLSYDLMHPIDPDSD